MNSFILIANSSKQDEYIKHFTLEHEISPFDITTLAEEGSIGIEIVRRMQETVFLKPYKSKEKLIVVKSAENLTPQAQNALLKLLEEPPPFTFIFLCSNTEEAFLPTVLSRCSIIKLEESEQKDQIAEEILIQDLTVLQNSSISEKLALAERLTTDKEQLPQWTRDMTLFVREKLLHTESTDETYVYYFNILKALHSANKLLTTTNVNPRMLFEHVFLDL